MEQQVKYKNGKTPIEAFEYGSFTASDGTVLPYRYYLPEDYKTGEKKYPLFLYMHGNGSRGNDNAAQLKSYSINTAVYNSSHDCIIVAPQCPGKPKSWTICDVGAKNNTYPGSEAYAAFLESGERYGSEYFCAAAELLSMFIGDYRVDTSRVYVGGGSNGSGATWNLLALYPEVFAAAVPVSGSRATEDYVFSVAHRYRDKAIWAFHGDDDNVVPTQGTRVMCEAAKKIGTNIRYTEVAGADHSNIWRIAADTDGLVDWLFSQRNESFENTIIKAKGKALPAPSELSWNGNAAAWDAVEEAGAYKVTLFVNGISAKTCFVAENTYVPDFETLGAGEYSFKVRAFPQNNNFSVGKESTESDVLKYRV